MGLDGGVGNVNSLAFVADLVGRDTTTPNAQDSNAKNGIE
jgi:hypothetical protein